MNTIQYSIGKIYFILTLFFIVNLLFLIPISAQEPYSKTYTTHDGLIHPQITALFKDSRNYLWIGTKGGVSRFNGKTFENFIPGEMNVITGIHQFHEDTNKHIWAINKFGIAIYDGSSWSLFRTPGIMKDVRAMGLKQDTLFFFDCDRKLWYFANTTFNSKSYINSTGLTPRNLLYCRLTDKCYVLFDENPSLGILLNDTIKFFKAFNEEEIGLYTDERTFVWRVFKEDTVFIYDLNDRLMDRVAINKAVGEVNYTKVENNNPLLWNALDGLITRNSTLHSFFKKSRNKPNITTVLVDSYNYWLGTELGLVQIPKAGFFYFNKDSISFPWGIIEDSDHNIIIADFLNGLYSISQEHSIKNISKESRWYFHPCKDEKGRIYLYKETEVYQLENGSLKLIPELSNLNAGFTACLYLFWSPTLKKLICSQRGGIWIYDPELGNVEKIRWTDGDFKTLYVLSIDEDKQGNLWCGSYKGLVRYNPHKKTETYYTNEKFKFEGVIAIYPMGDSLFFLGSNNGLWKFDIKKQVATQILKSNLKHPVLSILCFKDSLLICGHNKGLTTIKLQELFRGQESFREFNFYNGFPGIVPDQNAAYLDSQDNYWVSGMDRLCVIKANLLWHNEEPLRIQFTKLNGKQLTYSQAFALSTSGKSISFEFDVIGNLRLIEQKFRYRILDETSWSEWFSFQHVILPELSSGRYQIELELEGVLNGNLNKASSAILNIQVKQKIFMEPWFNSFLSIVSLCILGGLGWYIYKLRNSRKKIRQLEQESKYHQARMLTAQLNPHFMSNFLTSIQNSVNFQDTEKANRKLLQVANFLRKFLGSLNSKQKGGLIQLNDELEIIRIFLDMQNVLHNGLITWNIEMHADFDPTEWLVPPLILQPYIENAVVWGIDYKDTKTGNVNVIIKETLSTLRIQIIDDGVGIEHSQKQKLYKERKVEESGAQIVKQRIALLKTLGFEIKMEIQSNLNGTEVLLIYPKIKV
ncbi:MAG: histidine kinase [Saprospiraceae bacterium]|nr:histidine kinase [Saprospiraceae bacterium]